MKKGYGAATKMWRIPNIDFFPIFFSTFLAVFLEKLMIKSFHPLQDTQLWDRNPHKQGETGNILLNHMNLVRPLIPAKWVNLVIVVTVMIQTECLLLMVDILA